MATAQQRAFGTLLKHHRKARGWTQPFLAEQAKLSERRVQGLEKGEGHVPQPYTVAQLADALDLTGEAFAAAWAAGQIMTLQQTITHALDEPPAN